MAAKAPPTGHITILNPLAVDRAQLRVTLLPALLETAQANLRFTDRVAIFELGRVYLPRPTEELPSEPRRLAALVAGYLTALRIIKVFVPYAGASLRLC